MLKMSLSQTQGLTAMISSNSSSFELPKLGKLQEHIQMRLASWPFPAFHVACREGCCASIVLDSAQQKHTWSLEQTARRAGGCVA